MSDRGGPRPYAAKGPPEHARSTPTPPPLLTSPQRYGCDDSAELPHLVLGEKWNIDMIHRSYGDDSQVLRAKYNVDLPTSLMSGEFEFATGPARVRYEGTCIDRGGCPVPHGVGIRRNGDGCQYRGEWKDGRPHGIGEFIDPKLNESYCGEWRGGWRQGFGIAKFQNGDKYEGEWFKGKFHDRGNYFYSTGDCFAGTWADGVKVEGTFYFRDGRESRRTYSNGRLMSTQDYDPKKKCYLPTVRRHDVHNPDNTRYQSAVRGAIEPVRASSAMGWAASRTGDVPARPATSMGVH